MSEQDMQRLADAQGAQGPSTAVLAVTGLVTLVFALLMIASSWKVFTKAGEPGWASIVPIYNLIVWVKISGKPFVWVLYLFVPCVGIVISVLLLLAIAERFGKGAGFGIGLLLFPVIFLPMLAFGDAQYTPAPRT